jgi:hypothetical protein
MFLPARKGFVERHCGGQYELMVRYAGYLRERVPRRIADTLVELANRFGVADADGVALNLRVAREVIAGLVGCSRELVTRILINFERRGLILRGDRELILNAAGLKKVGAVTASVGYLPECLAVKLLARVLSICLAPNHRGFASGNYRCRGLLLTDRTRSGFSGLLGLFCAVLGRPRSSGKSPKVPEFAGE